MTAHLVHDDTFTAATIADTAGATLTVERTDDGVVSAWIAKPGASDGHSVLLDEADVIALVAYLSAGTSGALVPATEVKALEGINATLGARCSTYANEVGSIKAELERMRIEWDRLVNERAAMLGVVEAAKVWRAQFEKPASTKLPRMAALIAAVDALEVQP